jgi:hypothetical protein
MPLEFTIRLEDAAGAAAGAGPAGAPGAPAAPPGAGPPPGPGPAAPSPPPTAGPPGLAARTPSELELAQHEWRQRQQLAAEANRRFRADVRGEEELGEDANRRFEADRAREQATARSGWGVIGHRLNLGPLAGGIMQRAAGGVFGEAGAEAIGGAVAGIMPGVAVAEQVMANLKGSIEAVGHAAAAVAGNDYLGAMKQATDRMGIAVQLAAAPVYALSEAVEAFVRRGRELAEFSAPLAMAGAQADVRSLLSDIKEAQVTGPDLAKLTDAQSRLWADLREILLPWKAEMIRLLTAMVEIVHAQVTVANAAAAGTQAFWDDEMAKMRNIMQGNFAEVTMALLNQPANIGNAIMDALTKKGGDPPALLEALYKQNLLADPAVAGGRDPVGDAAAAALGIKAVGGF